MPVGSCYEWRTQAPQFERARSNPAYRRYLRIALKAAGVIFIEENGEGLGCG